VNKPIEVAVVRAGYYDAPEKHSLDPDQPILPQVYKLIGCELVEVVRLPGDALLMLVDEEGLLHNKPLNSLASIVSGVDVVGDVAVLAEKDFQ